MMSLAIELSTRSGSAALLNDQGVAASCAWEEDRRGGQPVFSVLSRLLGDAQVDASRIDMFAVGLGPGSFSGLRISISAALGLALPGAKPVVGISSAEALAWDLLRELNVGAVAVVGDARRGRLWVGRYDADGDRPSTAVPLHLAPAEELADHLDGADIVAGPDWDRIGPILAGAVPQGVRSIAERRVPRAASVGDLALRGARTRPPGRVPTPSPIYLHPPVFIEPRFTNRALPVTRQ
jgi:tRNA threonylcarbamoyladenosine biosynthesis protein TsaB